MKKFIATLALGAIMCGDCLADNHTYTYSYWDEDFEEYVPYMGILRRVSPNGRWVVGGDEDEQTGGYMIDTEEPELLIFTEDGSLLDVSDDGLAVGTYFERLGGGYVSESAGIFKNGEWIQLPLPEEIIGRSHAVCISADSKRIAGHALCAHEDPTAPGRYFPLTWKLNEETGEYELDKLYNSLDLPGTYGFFVYAMTPDGRYICGQQSLDFSDVIAAMLDTETGELTIWHRIEIHDWSFDGIEGYYPTMFVDDVMDGWDPNEYFMGRILYANNRYLFGSHAIVTDVDVETGEGHITNYPAVYDLQEQKWIDGNPKYGTYMSGINPDEVFTSTGDLIRNGNVTDITDFVDATDRVDGVYGFDSDCKTWACSQIVMSPLGEQVESPVLVMLEGKGLVGAVKKVEKADKRHSISVANGCVTISGADKVDIFSVSGAHVASDSGMVLAPGVYVAVADGISYKIFVR